MPTKAIPELLAVVFMLGATCGVVSVAVQFWFAGVNDAVLRFLASGYLVMTSWFVVLWLYRSRKDVK